jgi:soluble lytic murein transglycosylase-like protein
MKSILHVIGLMAGLTAGLTEATSPLWAGEYVVLSTGFRLHADRHEIAGGVARIYSDAGVAEIPAAAIAAYEPEEAIPAPAPEPSAATPPSPPVPVHSDAPRDLAVEVAKKYGLPESFVASVMKAESAFQPAAVSPKGAIGLMQLMPDTARTLGVDPRDPHQNADGGAQYLRQLLAKYENDPNQVLLALAAYNAGPAAVERWHGVPPYRETREYILRVLKDWRQASK